jgi:acetyl esterase/lipase
MIPLVKTKFGPLGIGLMLAWAFAASWAWAEDNPEILKDVEIGQIDEQTMHVDIVRPLHSPYSPMPVVFTIHSGGWKDGTYHNYYGTGNLAQKGFLVVSIEYHAISATLHWPVQLQDCLRAVRWMRVNAAKYNADPNRFATYGTSAGGHLATAVAIYADDPRFADPAYPGVSAAVQAVISGDGPLDILTSQQNHTNAPVSWNEKTLAGGTPEEKPEAWKEITMALHVSNKLPPFFIWHGDQDKSVPIAEAMSFVDALKKAGVPVEFVIVKNGMHDAFKAADKSKPTDPAPFALVAQIDDFLIKYLAPPAK